LLGRFGIQSFRVLFDVDQVRAHMVFDTAIRPAMAPRAPAIRILHFRRLREVWRRGVSGELTGRQAGRIKGSMIYRMHSRSLSANQLAALAALMATPAAKAKASITLSGNLLKVIDSLAGAAQRSAWIERAVQSYATRQLKERRRERELELLNKHADALNAEGDDSATYQTNWTAE